MYRQTLRKNKAVLAAFPLGMAALLPAAHADPAPTVAHRLIWGSEPHKTTHREQATQRSSAVILKIAGPLTPARQAALTKLGAHVTARFDFIGSVAADVPARTLPKIAALPFVTHVSQDGLVKKCDDFTNGASGAYTAFTNCGLDGTGVNVAVLDTGINVKREDVQNQVLAGVSFVPGDPSTDDICGHGTHVGGIVAGNGISSTGSACTRTFYGVARHAGLVNVRVLDKNGLGTVSAVISGIQWVVANKNSNNVRVLNLSLGHPVGESYTTDPLCQAVEAAWKAGIVVVCAAGNTGRANAVQVSGAPNDGWETNYGSIQSPGNDPYVITVGATKNTDSSRAHDKIASYSSRGPSRLDLVLKPDIIAPGNKVISVAASNCVLFHSGYGVNQIPQSYYTGAVQGVDISTRYFRLSGTSMAAPVVAGAAALLLQASPNLTPDTVKARLMASADKWNAPDGTPDPCTYGAGYLNIPAALKSTLTATRPALSPALVRDANGNVFLDTTKIVSGSHVIWGSTGLTDLHIIWGSTALTASSVSNAFSGTAASHVIWGSSVWGDQLTWKSSASAVDLSSVVVGGE